MHILPTHTRTNIVATIGPVSESPQAFETLLRAGIRIARTNMSHDDHVIHGKRIKTIRRVSKRTGIPVAILQDLSGPKIRIGDFAQGPVELVAGKTLILSGTPCVGDATRVYFNYPHIAQDIKPGMTLMLDDGKKELKVKKVVGTHVYTQIVVGGVTKSRRGVNIPGAYLSIDTITPKDKKDLAFGIEQGVDFVALSFVRTAQDIHNLRALINRHKGTQAIVAKIETQEAVEHIEDIIRATDAVMVARGDLAIEIGAAKVPAVQKKIIRIANELGKPVIVATQMLESMIHAPVPTRAEVSDVANAIRDGADAVMLSEETTLGTYASQAVNVMATIAHETEGEFETHRRLRVQENNIVDTVSSSVVHAAEDVHARAIITLTEGGSTPRMIARYKPLQLIVALTPHAHIARQLLLAYNTHPMVIPSFKSIMDVMNRVGPKLIQQGIAKKKDRIVVSAGVPMGTPGSTNMLMILSI